MVPIPKKEKKAFEIFIASLLLMKNMTVTVTTGFQDSKFERKFENSH